MIDSVFKEMLDDGIVDYGIILQSWIGIPGTNIKLEPSVVVDFAIDKLNNSLNASEEKLLIDLTSSYLLDDIEILAILNKLCDIIKNDSKISLRKWRLYLLESNLHNSDKDPLYFLIKLSEFWIEWEKVLDDSIPHVYQGINNNLSPQDYYSENNMNLIINSHKVWIDNEKNELKK